MVWFEIKAAAQNPYLAASQAAVYDGLANACADALGVKKEDVVITRSAVEGPETLLVITATLPQQYGAEKQQLSTFILKNLAAGAQVKPRDAALIINEVPKQNLAGLWSVK